MGGDAHGGRLTDAAIRPHSILVLCPKQVSFLSPACRKDIYDRNRTDWNLRGEAIADQHLCSLPDFALPADCICRTQHLVCLESHKSEEYKNAPANDGTQLHLCISVCARQSR